MRLEGVSSGRTVQEPLIKKLQARGGEVSRRNSESGDCIGRRLESSYCVSKRGAGYPRNLN